MLNHFPDPAEFFYLSGSYYESLNLQPETIFYLKSPHWQGVEQDIAWLNSSEQHHVLTLAHKDYPKLLREITDPPPIIFIKGSLAGLNNPQIAIVGSRNPSPAGKEIAFSLGSQLGAAGLIITSGLAQGIDTAAHCGALETSTTHAVVGTGLNRCYPFKNKNLADRISHQGALISEFCFDTPPLASNFPRRNRLISGLTLGTLVVEANLNSGSLITASYALEGGREVFAIPGSIYNPRARGCHLLIKQGATLVEKVEDVIEGLAFFKSGHFSNSSPTKELQQKTLEDDHLMLLECIGYEPTKIDTVVERSKHSVSDVTSLLVDLELKGFICSSADGYMRVS